MPIFGALLGLFLFGGVSLALPASASAPAKTIATYEVTLTGYNAVPEQTDDTPFETASGAFANPEIVAARSRDLSDELPFGTIIAIEGPTDKQNNCGYVAVSKHIGYRVIEDTMSPKFTKRIDVLFEGDKAVILGRCNGVTIRIVGQLSARTNQLPTTQAELAALISH